MKRKKQPGKAVQRTVKKEKAGIWAITAMALFFLLMLQGICVQAQEEEERVLKVAFPEADGINEVYEDGTYGGCVYDWLQEIAKYTGWKYEFVTEGNTSEQIRELIYGRADLMGGMYYAESFEELYNYPQYIMGSNYSLLIYRQDDEQIKPYDYTTLNGRKIGVFKRAASKIERLQEFLTFNNVSCELVYFTDSDAYADCLETGEADILLGSDVYMKDDYNVAAMVEGEPYYIVTAKDEPELCEELSAAMESIYEANPNFADELYKKYFPDKYVNSITFTEAEKAYIARSGVLKVAVMRDRYPLFYEENDKPAGVIPETLKLISEMTGLQFDYVYAQNHQEMIALVEAGKADLLGGFLDDDTFAASQGLARMTSVMQLDSVILRDKKHAGRSDKEVIAVPRGRSIKPLHPDDTVKYYDSYEECLKAVNSDPEVDYTRIPASFTEDFYAKDYYPNIALSADTNVQEEVSFALPLPVNVSLYSVLSKAINHFTQEQSRQILAKNTLSMPKSKATLKSLFYTNPVMIITLITVALVLLSAIVILIGFTRMRTKMMMMRVEKAEETSKAKSDFLSRMSHEIRTPMNAIIGLTNLTQMSGEATPRINENLSKIDSSAKFLLALLNDILDMSKIESEKMQIEAEPFDLRELSEDVKAMFGAQTADRKQQFQVVCSLENDCYIGDRMRLQQVLTNLLSNACKFTDPGGAVALFVEELESGKEESRIRFRVKDSGIGIRKEDTERIFDSFEQAKNSNLRAPGTGLGLSISSKMVSLMGGMLQVDSTYGEGSEFYFTISLPRYRGTIQRKEKHKKEIHLEGLRILLAEDNELNAEIAEELLQLKKMKVDRASDGEMAVGKFKESTEGYYDIILMDVNMPKKDGLEATREIRGMDRRDAKEIPILAMTANTFREDRDQAADCGMTGFLSKPFDVEQLYEALMEAGKKETE